MPSGPRQVTLPFEGAQDLFGLVHRVPQDIPNIGRGDLQMMYFSQEFANVLGRTSRDHLVRPHDHGTQITEIRCPRNSTPSLLKRRANTSATMFQSSSLRHARRPARTDRSPARPERRVGFTLPLQMNSSQLRPHPVIHRVLKPCLVVIARHLLHAILKPHQVWSQDCMLSGRDWTAIFLPHSKVVVTLKGRLVFFRVVIRLNTTAREPAVKGNHA